MKKLLFTLIIALCAVSINAQDVGQIWVGGSVGIWSSKTKESDAKTSYKILPEFGYMFSKNLGVGINIGYTHVEGDEVNISGNIYDLIEGDGFIVAPFVRYTFLKGNIGGLFVDGGISYTHLKNEYLGRDFEGMLYKNESKTNIFEVGFKPGVAINISSKVSLTGKFGFLGYQHDKTEITPESFWGRYEDEIKTNSFGLDIDLSRIELGAAIVF